MEDNRKIFIRGSKEHGDKIIKYLEELGENYSHFNGENTGCIYLIDHDNHIDCYDARFETGKIIMEYYKEVTIDEVLAHLAGKNKWDYDGNHVVNGYRIVPDSKLAKASLVAASDTKDTFATRKHAKSALAMAQISQYMTNDPRYGGIITDEEWCDGNKKKFYICRFKETYTTGTSYFNYRLLTFHTKEQRELFLTEHEDLVREYLMID